MNTTAKTEKTVLPYVLGGKDDPHFQDFSHSTFSSKDDGDKQGMAATVEEGTALNTVQVNAEASVGRSYSGNIKYDAHFEDIGGNWTPDRIEANEDWWDREDWEVTGNGGTNDHLFEDNENA